MVSGRDVLPSSERFSLESVCANCGRTLGVHGSSTAQFACPTRPPKEQPTRDPLLDLLTRKCSEQHGDLQVTCELPENHRGNHIRALRWPE